MALTVFPLCLLCLAGAFCAGLTPDLILHEARGLQPWLVDIRRTLHSIPELGYKEFSTKSVVLQALDSLEANYGWVGGWAGYLRPGALGQGWLGCLGPN